MSEVVTAARAAQLVGVSEKTMLRWLDKGKVPSARKVSPMGEAARWEVPVGALDGLRRSTPAASGDELADLRRRVGELEEAIALLRRHSPWLFRESSAPPSSGAGQQAASALIDRLGLGRSVEPSDLPLSALQPYSTPQRTRNRGRGGQDIPPEPGAERLGKALNAHGVVSESGNTSTYWQARLKAAGDNAGVFTQPSQRNPDVPEYWVLLRDRARFVQWLADHVSNAREVRMHACEDPTCPCQDKLPPALGARADAVTVIDPTAKAGGL